MGNNTRGFHRVTVSDVYTKQEETQRELRELKAMLAVLVDRDKRDYERLQLFDRDIKWLQRAVYAVGIPLMGLLGGLEAARGIWL